MRCPVAILICMLCGTAAAVIRTNDTLSFISLHNSVGRLVNGNEHYIDGAKMFERSFISYTRCVKRTCRWIIARKLHILTYLTDLRNSFIAGINCKYGRKFLFNVSLGYLLKQGDIIIKFAGYVE